jgi:hypothetical protein
MILARSWDDRVVFQTIFQTSEYALDLFHTSHLAQYPVVLNPHSTPDNTQHQINFLRITMLPQLEGKSLLFGTTASCGLGFMLFGIDKSLHDIWHR